MEKERTRQSRAANLLDAMQRFEVKDMWFNGKTVRLDGYSFVSCRFDNCKIQINSIHFEMHRCFLDDNTIIAYQGEIVKLIRLFNVRYIWVYDKLPYFAPEKHEDGTITISYKEM